MKLGGAQGGAPMVWFVALFFHFISLLALANSSGNQDPVELPGDLPLSADGQSGFQVEITPAQPDSSPQNRLTPGQQQFFGQIQAIQNAIRNIENMEIQIDPNSIDLGPEFYAYLESDAFKASIAQYLQEHQTQNASPQDQAPIEQVQLYPTPQTVSDSITEATQDDDSDYLNDEPIEIADLSRLPYISGSTSTLVFSTSPETLEGQELRRLATLADQLEDSSEAFQVAAGISSKIHLWQSDAAFTAGDASSGNESLLLARELIDAGLGFIPFVSNALDAFTAITGFNPIIGREVSPTERVLAAIGTFLPGVSKITRNIDLRSSVLAKAIEKFKQLARIPGKAGVAGQELAQITASHISEIESALKKSSDALELAAKHINEWYPKNKHILNGGSQSKSKFATDDFEEIRALVVESMKSPGAIFKPNLKPDGEIFEGTFLTHLS